MIINSWHSVAHPSMQCCCGIAGVRERPAPGWCPEGSWQMVPTQERPHLWRMTNPTTLDDTQRRRAPLGQEREAVPSRARSGKGRPVDWAGGVT